MSATIETLTAQLQELQTSFLSSIETISTAINEIQEEQKKNDDILAPFSAFLTVELTPYFGASGATMIVDKLKRCRAIADYRYFIPVYKIAGEDLKKRQLLKLVSAVHRYKFGGYKNPEKYSLRSEIKYAKACDDCGKLANTLYTRLQKEGLI
jgi:hypothetical protein